MATKSEANECSICLTTYKTPKILKCQHIFCLQCLDDYVQKANEEELFQCPVCRCEINIPEGGLLAFPSFVEDMSGDDSKQAELEKCNVCDKGIAGTFQCFECDKIMCSSCKKFHDVFSQKHEVDDIQKPVNGTLFCKNHPLILSEFFCKDCDILCCSECVETDHQVHITTEIKELLKDASQEFEEYVQKIDEKFITVQKLTDQFRMTQKKYIQKVTQDLHELDKDLTLDFENACQNEKKNGLKDKNLVDKLNAAIKRIKNILERPGNKDMTNLISDTLELQSKIQTHNRFFLPNKIAEIIHQIGSLDVTKGRQFEFEFLGVNLQSNVFFCGGIHWQIDASVDSQELNYEPDLSTNSGFGNSSQGLFGNKAAQNNTRFAQSNKKPSANLYKIHIILKSFQRVDDSLFVELVDTGVTFSLTTNENDYSTVKTMNGIFISSADTLSCDLWFYCTKPIFQQTCFGFNQKQANKWLLKVIFDNNNVRYRTQLD